ncbi:MAG: phosphoesterase [Pirellulaceae bacterium]
MKNEEHILVIPAAVIESLGAFEGFQPDVDRYLKPMLHSEQLSFQPRSQMEEDPSFKQLIPYVLMEWADDSGRLHLFRYMRGGGQGEKRLHSKYSVGIGGHISSEDADSDDVYRAGMLRELTEEVEMETAYEEELVGLIYDPSNAVGQVHVGIVHRFRLAQPNVRNRESELIDSGFVDIASVRAERDRLETWSQLCLDHLYFND